MLESTTTHPMTVDRSLGNPSVKMLTDVIAQLIIGLTGDRE